MIRASSSTMQRQLDEELNQLHISSGTVDGEAALMDTEVELASGVSVIVSETVPASESQLIENAEVSAPSAASTDTKQAQPQWACRICDQEFTSERNQARHMESKKHALAVQSQQSLVASAVETAAVETVAQARTQEASPSIEDAPISGLTDVLLALNRLKLSQRT